MTSSLDPQNQPTLEEAEETPVLDQKFIECLEAEADSLRTSFNENLNPMVVHARAMLWVDTLVKMHAVGLDQSIKAADSAQSAIWSRDLGTLELALALLQNVKPLDPDQDSSG